MLIWNRFHFLRIDSRQHGLCHSRRASAPEVDFVASKNDETFYYQVSATTLEESTLERELAPFAKIKDNYPKTLLTLDTLFGNANYSGVQKRNVLEWLME